MEQEPEPKPVKTPKNGARCQGAVSLGVGPFKRNSEPEPVKEI